MTGFAFQPSASFFGLPGRGLTLAAHLLCALPSHSLGVSNPSKPAALYLIIFRRC
jgi:hypothetical protein